MSCGYYAIWSHYFDAFEPVLDPTIAAVHSAVCAAAVDVCVNKEMTRPAAVLSVFLLLGPPQAAAGVAKALTNGLPLSLSPTKMPPRGSTSKRSRDSYGKVTFDLK